METDYSEARDVNQGNVISTTRMSNMCARCPNCQVMLNEIGNLQAELVKRMEMKQERKYFSIAHTVYTFYQNRLEKHNILRWLMTVIQSYVGWQVRRPWNVWRIRRWTIVVPKRTSSSNACFLSLPPSFHPWILFVNSCTSVIRCVWHHSFFHS